MSASHCGHGATASAFDRLFHRLVVAGDRPVVRKKKKKTAKKPPVSPPPSSPEASASSAFAVATAPPPASRVELSAVDRDAVACVQRLRLYRNVRRLSRLPRAIAIERLGTTGFSSSRRRRGQRRQRLVLSPVHDARRFMRLEAIAARLYDRLPVEPASAHARVLDDFCFPFAAVAFQSQAHYDYKTRSNVVPLPPVIGSS